MEITDDEETDRMPMEDVLDTHCGAEWLIVTDEDWNKFTENEEFSFLLEAAGYKKIDP